MYNQLVVRRISSSNETLQSALFGINVVGKKHESLDVLYVPASVPDSKSRLKLKHTEIDQVEKIAAVILHKSPESWGAWSGSNEHDVVIGCGSCEVKPEYLSKDPTKATLLETEVVRLALERGKSASESFNLIKSFLATYNIVSNHESNKNISPCFVIVDKSTTWIIETAGKFWVAEQLKNGSRLLRGSLTISLSYDDCGDALRDSNQLNFSVTYEIDSRSSESIAPEFMSALSMTDSCSTSDVMKMLRDLSTCVTSDLCVLSSQVSCQSESVPCHWFTATQDPNKSVFKPFIFSPHCSIGTKTFSSTEDCEGASSGGGRSELWGAHQSYMRRVEEGEGKAVATLHMMRELEENCLQDVTELITQTTPPTASPPRVAELFKHIVDLEMNFF